MSDRSLAGKRIAFLAADGVEQIELERPWHELEEAGAELELVSLADGGLITSRKPDDLDAFCQALTTALAESEQGFEPDGEPELVGAGGGTGGRDN